MNKTQYWIFNVVSLALVLLMVGQFLIGRTNRALSEQVGQQQALVNNARQLEPVLDQLAKRIARDSDTNAALRNLLVKYGMNVTLQVDGKEKKYP